MYAKIQTTNQAVFEMVSGAIVDIKQLAKN